MVSVTELPKFEIVDKLFQIFQVWYPIKRLISIQMVIDEKIDSFVKVAPILHVTHAVLSLNPVLSASL